MFTQSDFDIFKDQTLTGRMAKIRAELDPKFVELNYSLQLVFSQHDLIVYPHIAKHARRSVNPPVNTWIAFGPNKRGYKKDPHFEIGFWDDRFFIWLSLLEQSKALPQLVQPLMTSQSLVAQLPAKYVLSPNHTDKRVVTNTADHRQHLVENYQTKRTSEFLIGRVWLAGDSFFSDDQQNDVIQQTVTDLLPIYQKWNQLQ